MYVTKTKDTAAIINAKLAAGLHVVVSPGIYLLDAPLKIVAKGQVLLGIGFATLVSARQTAVIEVGDVDGVRVAGLLLQAGPLGPDGSVADALLVWGTGKNTGSATDPGVVSDVFARVGGPDGTAGNRVAVDAMLVINSGNVIIDNTWLWRADHAAGGPVSSNTNPCKHGLLVYGDDVTAYGLASEHSLQDLVQWGGDRGRTYFYQSELPYTVDQAQFGAPGYCGYKATSF